MSRPTFPLMAENLLQTFADGTTTHTVLDRVSLRMRAGELVVLMGPSGSGKSTLLAVLSGLLRPTGGEVQVLEESLWKVSDERRQQIRRQHCGFIFQGFNLFPALTARQQLEIALRWVEGVGPTEARQRAEDTLRLLGLEHRMNLRPSQLSGGEKQRVAIGRAMVKQPALCFADEPTSALDWGHGEEVMERLRTAARDRGATVVVVSHDTRVIPFADRVLHLEAGRLREHRQDTKRAQPEETRR